ncbi:hypothetical protein BJY52DRAFT_1275679 [Lactarius psammicola]|nr:hypothetical protein BJY52DRAFT_1275679 [Lactarius psammicola]
MRVRLKERWRLLFVCEAQVVSVLSLDFQRSRVHIFTASAFEQFTVHLCPFDRRWDSIRCVSYSNPSKGYGYWTLRNGALPLPGSSRRTPI